MIRSTVTDSPSRAAVDGEADDLALPEPRVGDVVAYAGDWPGESVVGQIRSLQPRGGDWLADVVLLEDQAKADAPHEEVEGEEPYPGIYQMFRRATTRGGVTFGTCIKPGMDVTPKMEMELE